MILTVLFISFSVLIALVTILLFKHRKLERRVSGLYSKLCDKAPMILLEYERHHRKAIQKQIAEMQKAKEQA